VRHSPSILLPIQIVPSNNLATAGHTYYTQSEDLEKVITYYREVLDLCPASHPNPFITLNDLDIALRTRYEQCGRMEDHIHARCICAWSFKSSLPLSNIGSAVHTRYQQSGRLEDLDEAITYMREAFTFCPPGHPVRSTTLPVQFLLAMSSLTE
jgi:hypothetical protein